MFQVETFCSRLGYFDRDWDICTMLKHFVIDWDICITLRHFVLDWDILSRLGYFVHIGIFCPYWDVLFLIEIFCSRLGYFVPR